LSTLLLTPMMDAVAALADRRSPTRTAVVGRVRELALMRAVLGGGGNLVLEGPPGTSKTTLLRAITEERDLPLFIVEGNADLTPTKLTGYHDPAAVLHEGYIDENFLAGPLVQAMRSGGILYFEELNRAPAETLNTLLTAIGDRYITVPRLGRVVALDSFRVVASMNPYDNVGTHRLSPAVHDRLCRLALDYQGADAERAIVLQHTSWDNQATVAALAEDAVAITRATRGNPELRAGSSIRGAIDLFSVAQELLRQAPVNPRGAAYRRVVRAAMMVALSGRVHLDDASECTPELVLHGIWMRHFGVEPEEIEPG
jgi:MoxR-like ATPase